MSSCFLTIRRASQYILVLLNNPWGTLCRAMRSWSVSMVVNVWSTGLLMFFMSVGL